MTELDLRRIIFGLALTFTPHLLAIVLAWRLGQLAGRKLALKLR